MPGTHAESSSPRRARDAVDRILDEWGRQRPDLDPSPMGVFGRVARIAALKRAHLTELSSRYGLTPASFDVLANLRRSEPPHSKTPTELAASSMMSTGGMTFRVDKLEAAGLVQRSPSRADRRVVEVKLTPEGKQLMDIVIAEHLQAEEELLRGLSRSERDTLAKLLSNVEAGLRGNDA